MRREIDINEITKDKLMDSDDLAKVGCNDCEGCSRCCAGMGNSIVLDPYDVMMLTSNLGCDFPSLLSDKLQLNVVDGIILPNIAMAAGPDDACFFLNEQGRCSIHSFRPGICRLFPLGRIYEDGSFKYFLQSGECVMKNRTKVRIKNFLGIEDLKSYEAFVVQWHYFLNDVEAWIVKIQAHENGAELTKGINMWILNTFYITPFRRENFYEEITRRIALTREKLI